MHHCLSIRAVRRFACAGLLLAAVAAAAAPQGQPAEASRRPRIGLVLSGGGALGIAHVGVLKVLEENRIPVDFIAGTSMGAIVGAAYASGMTPQEMERIIASTDWERVFADLPRRRDLPARNKQLDVLGLWGLEIGFSKGRFMLPKGAIEGQQLSRVLRSFVTEPPDGDFGRLPIPFRCVATDLVTGEMVVMARGDLPSAMRASMSVPGIVSPQEREGRLLVDGMLVRNLPVDIVREMGAEVVIAVNVGSEPLKREDLGNVFGVTLQMVNLLTQQNVDKSLAELKPGDVLVRPQLEGFSAGSFNEGGALIPRGEAAARAVVDQLRRFSLTDEAYEAFRLAQMARLPAARRVTGIDVKTEALRFVNPAFVEATLKRRASVRLDRPGEMGATLMGQRDTLPDQDEVDRAIDKLYGTGDFDRIEYRYEDEGDGRTLVVEPTERTRGPDYFRFGLRLRSDFNGEGDFNLLAFYNKTWINRLGAEWRTFAQVGRDPGIASELYQPIHPAGYLFVAPRAYAGERLWNIFVDGDRIAQYQVRQAGVGLDLGAVLDKWGELRIGVVRGAGAADPSIALPSFLNFDFDVGAVTARLIYDQLDSVNFPTQGSLFTWNVFSSQIGLGASNRYDRTDVAYLKALSRGAHAVTLTVKGGTSFSGTTPIYDGYALGGFLNLSGYRTGQFLGQELAFARAMYYYRLYSVPKLAEGVFVGGSLEAGNVYGRFDNTTGQGILGAAAVFVGAETLIGPAYLAYGQAFDGTGTFYFFLGPLP